PTQRARAGGTRQGAGKSTLGPRPIVPIDTGWGAVLSKMRRRGLNSSELADNQASHLSQSENSLTDPITQTRAGESGSWFGIAPNERKGLPTAVSISPPT